MANYTYCVRIVSDILDDEGHLGDMNLWRDFGCCKWCKHSAALHVRARLAPDFRLSAKVLKEKPEGYVEPERRPRPERPARREGGEGRGNREGGNGFGGNRENREGGNGFGNRDNHEGEGERRSYPRRDERFGHETRRPRDPEADGARLRRN